MLFLPEVVAKISLARYMRSFGARSFLANTLWRAYDPLRSSRFPVMSGQLALVRAVDGGRCRVLIFHFDTAHGCGRLRSVYIFFDSAFVPCTAVNRCRRSRVDLRLAWPVSAWPRRSLDAREYLGHQTTLPHPLGGISWAAMVVMAFLSSCRPAPVVQVGYIHQRAFISPFFPACGRLHAGLDIAARSEGFAFCLAWFFA